MGKDYGVELALLEPTKQGLARPSSAEAAVGPSTSNMSRPGHKDQRMAGARGGRSGRVGFQMLFRHRRRLHAVESARAIINDPPALRIMFSGHHSWSLITGRRGVHCLVHATALVLSV